MQSGQLGNTTGGKTLDMKEVAEAAANNGWWVAPGIIGRMMFHSREVQAGRRRFWGRELPFEMLIALGMGMIGYSVGVYWQFPGPVTAGIISTIAYLGPRFIDTAAARGLEWLAAKKGGE